MSAPIEDQVIDFYQALFGRIFSTPFQEKIKERLKRNAVVRQVQESADAASQSLSRLFSSQQLTEEQVAEILGGFAAVESLLELEQISKPNITPESMVESLLERVPLPATVRRAKHEAIYRVALHSVIQVLTLVGPVMAEWQKLNFSTTFELPRRVVNRINRISEALGELGGANEAAADERYELIYRDYLLQRFHRVEAGTVKMTTNLDVDLRELFVMPRLYARPSKTTPGGKATAEPVDLLDLAAARKSFEKQRGIGHAVEPAEDKNGKTALEQIKDPPRNVIIGPPGSGKSTFLEWLQLKLAAVEEELVMAGQQAIPLLLRVRQLDPQNLPKGAALIEKATASRDRAALMPPGWIERQMKKGRVLLMLDGLDETEPELRDHHILPWLLELCKKYPQCRYLISSRPVGYSPGFLVKLGFTECDLMDFGPSEITEYTRHWCTAIRLAHNEPEMEAREEGAEDGERIVQGFKDHPYINNLARNPLMLSAICLVNYFEGGQLPKDRAILYQLCVEGLLHHWDQRRGIHSEFTLEEKLRACREVALSMQSLDRAEFKASDVQTIFVEVLGDRERGRKLLEHIRYRTGLLLERRSGIFAFAHLTFQEYLAASAIHEGNRLDIGVEQLARDHDNGRWNEVIALYCGLSPAPAARAMLEFLHAQPDTRSLGSILAEAFLSTGTEISKDQNIRKKILDRIAVAPGESGEVFSRFSTREVAGIANRQLGQINSSFSVSEAYRWLLKNPKYIDFRALHKKILGWPQMTIVQITEIFYLLHRMGPDSLLESVVLDKNLYSFPGPKFSDIEKYMNQAEVALLGLCQRTRSFLGTPGVDTAWLQLFRIFSESPSDFLSARRLSPKTLFFENNRPRLPKLREHWPEYIQLIRKITEQIHPEYNHEFIDHITLWADNLEESIESSSPKSRIHPPKARKRSDD